jgi:hypothetical protein
MIGAAKECERVRPDAGVERSWALADLALKQSD